MKDMTLLRAQDLRDLAARASTCCVSIFMPTHRAGRDTRQDPIRLKNLLQDAERRMLARGIRPADADEILQPATALLDDPRFWQHQAEGLAIFIAPSRNEHYRVPLPLREQVAIGHRFMIKPLLPLLSGDGRFLVLAVSGKHVRLLECTRDACREAYVPGLPEGQAELMESIDHEKSLQFHSGTQVPTAGRGQRAAMFHGHGAVEADRKARLYEYFRQIDEALRPAVRNQRAPMLFAGVDFLFPIYREANTYENLLEEHISGNPDHLSDHALHSQAWPKVEPGFAADRRRAEERFRAAAGTGRTATALESILPAAIEGRIETLFVSCEASCWGRFDVVQRVVERHEPAQAENEDLLDLAAILTLMARGTVYAGSSQHVPAEGSEIAALLRY